MNKDNVKKCIHALRSGVFRQAKGALCQVTREGKKSYCCMGVFCEVARLDGLEFPVVEKTQDGYREVLYGEEQMSGTMPREVQEWLGLDYDANDNKNSNPNVSHDTGELIEVDNLANLNDNHEKTFEQIADILERNWL